MPKRGRAAAASSPDERPANRRSSTQSSQATQSKAAAQLQDLSEEVEKRLVRTVFRKVMFMHTKRMAAPRKEIKEAIGNEYHAAVLDHVIRQAQAQFESICGFRMVEVHGKAGKSYMLQASEDLLEQISKQPPLAVGTSVDVDTHLVKNGGIGKITAIDDDNDLFIVSFSAGGSQKNVPREALRALEQPSFAPASKGDAAIAGLLAAVVGQIVLAKGGIKKDEFWSLLNELGVSETDKDHPQLGNIKACIDSFKRQQYIDQVTTKSKVDHSTSISFHLGVRSKQELIRPKLRAFLDGQMGDRLDDDDFDGLCETVWPSTDQEADEVM